MRQRTVDAASGPRPADGERRAVRNLRAQYLVAAALTLEAIEGGEFDWVRLVDPEAGRLDDVVIARPGRLDAYQVKWSDYRRPVTFRDLIRPARSAGKRYPAPFELMAGGWSLLRSAHPGRDVHAHLLMRDAPSASDRHARPGGGDPAHLQSFLRNAFRHRVRWFEPDDPVRAAWAAFIDPLIEVVGLHGPDLERFVRDCELDLGFDLPRDEGRATDVEALATFLTRMVAERGGVVQLGREDVLRALGWGGRHEFRFRHDFPVDERLYRPIAASVAALEAAVGRFRQGYLALLGPPGSGKSTLLTQTLRYRERVRLVRYYAYVRDDVLTGRGEASAFLHDACVALQAFGAAGHKPHLGLPEDLGELRRRFAELLQDVGAWALREGGVAILLVDGLDHIDREQSPERSLVEELPLPRAVPEGVLIVLGTQPVGLRGGSPTLRPIRAHLNEAGRTLTMAPLSRADVHSIFRTAIPDRTSREDLWDRAHRACGGHPLSLAYLLRRILAAGPRAPLDRMLADGANFGGDIDGEYSAYWDQMEGEPQVRELLALLSRLRGAIHVPGISMLAPREVVERFASGAAQFFRDSGPGRWAFFHESFRIFVRSRTGVDAFGHPSVAEERRLHRRLADFVEADDAGTELRWEAIHHLTMSGDHAAVVARATQGHLRAHFMAGRPMAELREDVHRVLRAAAASGDVLALARTLLIHAELIERGEATGDAGAYKLAIELADPATRGQLLLAGDRARTSGEIAFEWVSRAFETGDEVLAGRLFDAVEPLGILSGMGAVTRDGLAALRLWAGVAWRFRSQDRIIEVIDRMRVAGWRDRRVQGSPEVDHAADEALRVDLLVAMGAGIQDFGDDRHADLGELLGGHALWPEVRLRLDLRTGGRHADGLPVRGDPVAAMRRVTAAIVPDAANDATSAQIADILVRIEAGAAQARSYLCPVPVALDRDLLRSSAAPPFAALEGLFHQSRAGGALGRPLDPEAIATPERECDVGRVLLQRCVVIVGTLWGEALSGRFASPAEFVRRIGPVLAMRRRDWRSLGAWHDWNSIDHALCALFERIPAAARAHGAKAFASAMDAIVSEWRRNREARDARWPTRVMRGVALAAWRIDGNGERAAALLAEVMADVDARMDVQERVDEHRADGWARVEIGRPAEARVALDAMLANSFGVYHHKDGRILDWVAWAVLLIDSNAEPASSSRAAETLLRLLAVLHRNRRGHGTAEATSGLIAALARRSPDVARIAGEWLLDNHAGDRAAVLGAIVGTEIRSGDPRRMPAALVAAARLVLPFAGFEQGLGEALGWAAASPVAADPNVARALAIVRRAALGIAPGGSHYLEALGDEPRSPRERAETESEGTVPSLELADGSTLGQADIEARAGDPAAFASLLSDAVRDEGVDWEPVILKALASGGPASDGVGMLLLERSLGLDALRALVARATEAGLGRLAELGLARILQAGRPHGWSRAYDGGSRIIAAQSLRAADPAGGAMKAMRLFADDYAANDLSIRRHAIDLRTLLSSFTDDLPIASLWAEIEKHVGALADTGDGADAMPRLDLGCTGTAKPGPVSLLLRDLDALPATLAWEARKGLIDVIALGDVTGLAREGLRSAMASGGSRRVAALATVSCLAHVRADLASDFVSDVTTCASSPEGVVRWEARSILRMLDVKAPTPQARALPAFYRLTFPAAYRPSVGLDGGDLPPGEPLPDTSDPFDLTRSYHRILEHIAGMGGLGAETLVRRMAVLMRDLEPPAAWNAEAERRHVERSRGIGLEMAYRRPRALAAQRAFGALVAELADAGIVEWAPRECERFLAVADAVVNMLDAGPRPDWLELPPSPGFGSDAIYAWLDGVGRALPTLDRLPDGRRVLCEATRVVGIGGERIEETRLSVVAHRKLRLENMPGAGLESLRHDPGYAARDYPRLLDLEAVPTTVVSGGCLLANSWFLGLHPRLGDQLGWGTSPGDAFRWTDAQGRTMAESLRWVQGNVEMAGLGFRGSSAAEGWLVVASDEGWRRILAHCGRFLRHRLASRTPAPADRGERAPRTAYDQGPLA